MNFYLMTDKALAVEIGARIKKLRLRRNRTQQQVANAAVVSLNVVKGLEAGKGKLSFLIAVLRELEALDDLEQFIQAPEVSPLDLVKLRGKRRQRASGTRERQKPEEPSEW